MSETEILEVLKLNPNFYCKNLGVCDRMYTCINPNEFLNPVCPYLVVVSSDRKLLDTILSERDKEAEEDER